MALMLTNNGSGALSITTTGTTTGTNYDGIYANNSSAGTSLTINAATTTGGERWHCCDKAMAPAH